MSQPQRNPMTSGEYLVWEEKQELKWEFDGFQPVAMTGGSVAHSRIQGNLIFALISRLRGKRCQPYGPDLKVPTGEGRYRYPDVLVTCSAMRPDSKEALEPVVLFEVLSGSIERKDRTVKLGEYRSIASVQRYVMLEQDEMLATVVARTAAGWSLDQVGPAGVLAMPEIDVEIPLAELYADVTFLED